MKVDLARFDAFLNLTANLMAADESEDWAFCGMNLDSWMDEAKAVFLIEFEGDEKLEGTMSWLANLLTVIDEGQLGQRSHIIEEVYIEIKSWVVEKA